MSNCVNKLLSALNFDTKLQINQDFNDKIYQSLGCYNPKKWVANIVPSEILNISLKEVIDLISTISEENVFYEFFPDIIKTPNYGDNWGRFANYIEINNRSIANMELDKTCCGIINSIKLLAAIPPSAKSFANCVILSQIFPNIYGDGYNKAPDVENSIYGIKLNCGYSGNIINYHIQDKILPDEQIRAFNDIAHFRGIKTGFRTVISADQIKVVYNGYEQGFSWDNEEHLEIYINEHVKLIKLGFEAIFIDSAKHIGGYEMENYTGVGALPQYHQAQYILHEIRSRSGVTSVAFIGEKTNDDFIRYENLGFSAGTDFIFGDDFNQVKNLSDKLKYNRVYAPGVTVENDNYEGGITYEQRLNRINSALFGYCFASDKLPSFMQMNDLFALRYDTNTHHIMMTNPNYSTDGTCNSHIENLFAFDDGRKYNHKVAELFAHALCR
ncbi:MAG: hypothetical protein IKL52_02090 [Candidatus Gastranaerophilales bacterium]|nr:hypothetical protein [Candidatus Gastranaerophilales bacterium]